MYIRDEIMIYLCIDNLKNGAIPAARLYHTKYRELPPPGHQMHQKLLLPPWFDTEHSLNQC